VPQSELAVFRTFDPRGSIPTFVFGNKYWRIGNGYEGQHNLIAEEAEFRRIIEKLVQNGETSSGEGEAAISFRMEEITVGEHPSAPLRSGSEPDDPAIYPPADSNIIALSNSPSGEDECEINGCGANGWKVDYIGMVVDQHLIGPYTVLLCTTFKDSCYRHDYCYCCGYATYCKGRRQCDLDFLHDMENDCVRTLCYDEDCMPWCCPDQFAFALCLAGTTAFYEAVDLAGDGPYEPHTTCYDYDNLGGKWECPAENPTTVYVDRDAGCPQHGTEGKPVSTVATGKEKVAPGGTVIIAAGSYTESLVISKSVTLEASGGSVVIGE